MGDPKSSDSSLRKLVIAKANHQWISNLKPAETGQAAETKDLSFDYEIPITVKEEIDADNHIVTWQEVEPEVDPLACSKRKKDESSDERANRLAKMSAYAAQRLANETPEQRALRLKRMSEYAAKRLASETNEQRAKRLARMSAYAARRLAHETPDKRRERLARMSAYAAKRHATKKMISGNSSSSSESNNT